VWIARELSRLLFRIAVAVAIACVIAGLKAALAGGPWLHTWRVTLFALAGLMLLLAMAGYGPAHRRVTRQSIDHGPTFLMRFPGAEPKPGDPTLTASAVFVGSGLALLALGFLV
jgi:hypothetical protein